MLKTIFIVSAAISLVAFSAPKAQAQTAGPQKTMSKGAKSSTAKGLPPCTRARQMSGKPCYGG